MSSAVWVIILFATLLAITGVGLGLLARALRISRDATTAEHERLTEARRSVRHLETRASTLRAELSEAHHTTAELTARVRRVGTDPRTSGLWALERYRQARLAGTPILGSTIGPGMDVLVELRSAVALDLELLRDEVGTHGELVGISLGNQVEARDALATLRVIQELTAALAKRSDELRVTVDRDSDDIVVTVEAVGWTEEAPPHGALTSSLTGLDAILEMRSTGNDLVAVVKIGRGSVDR
ncbi:MAG: hypothetical protein EXQ69_08360 [Acidimicrobiia bacterium]|nr:hypothetical protein [Acidimicrobiia bacterium]